MFLYTKGTTKVQRIHKESMSFREVSREYGISDCTLRDWERICWEQGEEALLAVAENLFGLLKTELFYLENSDSIDQLEKAIVEYIDYYCRRIKLKLNGLSPVQYRIQTVGAA